VAPSLVTTYFGHRISIEPFEWGYLAQVVEPTSGKCLVAGNSSAFQALEDAFEAVDGALEQPGEGSTAVG
jgi:hypothetical protein